MPVILVPGLASGSWVWQDGIASQHLEKPVLVGHSLGGTLSLQFAAEHPNLIAGVLTVDGLPVYPRTEGMPADQRPALAERVRASLDLPRPAFEAQQLQYMRRVGVVDEALAAVLGERTGRSDPTATALPIPP